MKRTVLFALAIVMLCSSGAKPVFADVSFGEFAFLEAVIVGLSASASNHVSEATNFWVACAFLCLNGVDGSRTPEWTVWWFILGTLAVSKYHYDQGQVFEEAQTDSEREDIRRDVFRFDVLALNVAWLPLGLFETEAPPRQAAMSMIPVVGIGRRSIELGVHIQF